MWAVKHVEKYNQLTGMIDGHWTQDQSCDQNVSKVRNKSFG